MPTSDYRLRDGMRVPGVTTVCGQLGWSKGALMYWAAQMGQKYPELKPNQAIAKERDSAANAGTVAHYLIDCHIRKKELSWEEIYRMLKSE